MPKGVKSVKDVRDPGTAEMALQPKRGRGRPRKADALTPAERAKRYRAARVFVPFDRLVVSDAQHDDLVRERDDLLAINAELRAELVKLQAQFAALVSKRDVTKKRGRP
jgi:hypothetical protein